MIRNLFGKAKSAISSLRNWNTNFSSKVTNDRANTLSGVGSAMKKANLAAVGSLYTPKVSASPLDVNQAFNSGGLTFDVNQTLAPNMTVAPTGTSPGGPGRDNIAYNDPSVQFRQTQAGVQATNQYNTRPSTFVDTKTKSTPWTPPIDQYGRESTAQVGGAFIGPDGRLVIPANNFSGLMGGGGGGIVQAPLSGKQGASGLGFSFGDKLSGGMGTNSSLYGTQISDDEERKGDKDTQNLSTYDQANKMTSDVAPFLLGGTPSGPQTPGVPPVFDAGWMENATKAVQAMQSYSGSDRTQVMGAIMNELQNAYNQVTVQAQSQGPMVEDTPEQQMFLDQLETPEEQSAFTKAKDEYTATKTELNELQASRSTIRAQIKATNEVMLKQINEIKDNPNLPKALARRRVGDILEVTKRASEGVLRQLDDIEDRIETQQRLVNDAFRIQESAESRYEKAQARIERRTNMYLSNETLLAGMTDKELGALSSASGIPINGLKKMRDNALTKGVDRAERIRPDGTLESYDRNTGTTLWTKSGMGTQGETIKSGNLVYSGQDAQDDQQALEASRGEDGYVDPAIFLRLQQAWVKNGGLLRDFLSVYNPKDYVNPANNTLPPYLRSSKEADTIPAWVQ